MSGSVASHPRDSVPAARSVPWEAPGRQAPSEPPARRPSILLVDADDDLAMLLSQVLRLEGYEVAIAGTTQQALAAARAALPDLVILDFHLPGVHGLEFFRRLRASVTAPVIVLTADAQEDLIVSTLEAGADDYITKPFRPRQLLARIRAALRRVQIERRQARAAHLRLAAVLDATTDAVASLALDGTIVEWNPAAERLYGYAAQEIVGQPYARLLAPAHPDDARALPDDAQALLTRLQSGEWVKQREVIRRRKDGRLVRVWWSLSPILDAQGEVAGGITVSRDGAEQAERMRLDGALLVARTTAHALTHALSPITVYADLLSQDANLAADPAALSYVQAIARAADGIAEKVNRLQRIIHLDEAPETLGLGPGEQVPV